MLGSRVDPRTSGQPRRCRSSVGTTHRGALSFGARKKKREARGHRNPSQSPRGCHPLPSPEQRSKPPLQSAGRSEGQTQNSPSGGRHVHAATASREVPRQLNRLGFCLGGRGQRAGFKVVGGASRPRPLRLLAAHPKEAEPWGVWNLN